MKLIRLAAAAVNQTPMDWDGNRRRIEAVIAEARDLRVGLLCLPELCISGYGCEDMFFSTGVQQAAYESMMALAPATRGMAVTVGLPVFYDSAVYNAAALLVDGELAGIVCKQYLAGDGIHYESRWFRRWPPGVRELAGRTRSATCCSTWAACGSASRSATTPGSPTGPGRGSPNAAPTSSSTPAPATSPSASRRSASGSCSKARGRSASATSTATCWATSRAAASTTATR